MTDYKLPMPDVLKAPARIISKKFTGPKSMAESMRDTWNKMYSNRHRDNTQAQLPDDKYYIVKPAGKGLYSVYEVKEP